MVYKVLTYYKKHSKIDGYVFEAKNSATAYAHVGHLLRLDNYGVRKSKIRLVAL